MTKTKPPYERVEAKAARGEYNLTEPLDYIIMSFLPNAGELFAGLYPIGETVSNLLKKFPEEQRKVLDSNILSARLRSMAQQNLTTTVHSRGAGGGGKTRVWQRTARGAELVNEWERKRGSNGHSNGNS